MCYFFFDKRDFLFKEWEKIAAFPNDKNKIKTAKTNYKLLKSDKNKNIIKNSLFGKKRV